jgi:hypothetical protein
VNTLKGTRTDLRITVVVLKGIPTDKGYTGLIISRKRLREEVNRKEVSGSELHAATFLPSCVRIMQHFYVVEEKYIVLDKNKRSL